MNIKIKFESKNEISFFHSCINYMFIHEKENLNYIEFYNCIDLLTRLQKKSLNSFFVNSKKTSMQLTPNHYLIIDLLWANCFEWFKMHSVIEYAKFQSILKRITEAYQEAENLNFNSQKKIN